MHIGQQLLDSKNWGVWSRPHLLLSGKASYNQCTQSYHLQLLYSTSWHRHMQGGRRVTSSPQQKPFANDFMPMSRPQKLAIHIKQACIHHSRYMKNFHIQKSPNFNKSMPLTQATSPSGHNLTSQAAPEHLMR